MNPNMRWCPKADCIHYVEKVGKKNTAMCECGTEVCLKCGAVAHAGVRCANVGDIEMA